MMEPSKRSEPSHALPFILGTDLNCLQRFTRPLTPWREKAHKKSTWAVIVTFANNKKANKKQYLNTRTVSPASSESTEKNPNE
ncbi:hypothetical protein RUM43_000432 [Polyplax serrata]|uniref:Uncharacterized protein n=1 Tax=Polyplax serrata TaxID=468196 RepID=A0AAN8SH18_POLSC